MPLDLARICTRQTLCGTQRGEDDSMQPADLYKRTRSSTITCLSFGPNRTAEFPDYFFCHECDLWEEAVTMQNKRARRNQKTYMCTGGHVDPTRPTTLKVGYRPNNNRSFADDEEEKDSKQSPSKSPLKKKTRRPPAMSSVDSDDDEDGGEEHSAICDPRRLFANESSNGTTTKSKMASPGMCPSRPQQPSCPVSRRIMTICPQMR